MDIPFKQLCNGFSYLYKQIADMNNKDISQQDLHGILIHHFELISKYLIILRTYKKFKNIILGDNAYMAWVLNQQYFMLKTIPDYIDIFAVQEMNNTPILPLHWPIKHDEQIQEYKDIELYSHLKLLCEYYIQIDHHVKCEPKFPDLFHFSRKSFYNALFKFDTTLGYWKLVETDFLDNNSIDIDQLQSELFQLPPCPIPMILVNFDRYLYKQSIQRKFNSLFNDSLKWTRKHQHKLIKTSSHQFLIKLFPDSKVVLDNFNIQIDVSFDTVSQLKSIPIWLAEKLQLRPVESDDLSSNKRRRRKSKANDEFYEFSRSSPILVIEVSCLNPISNSHQNIFISWLLNHSKITFTSLSDTEYQYNDAIVPWFSIQKSLPNLFNIFDDLAISINQQTSSILGESMSTSGFIIPESRSDISSLSFLSTFPVKSFNKLQFHGYLFNSLLHLVNSDSVLYSISTSTLLLINVPNKTIFILKCLHGQLIHFYKFKSFNVKYAIVDAILNDIHDRLLYYRVECRIITPLVSNSNKYCLDVGELEIEPIIEVLHGLHYRIYVNNNEHLLRCNIQEIVKWVICFRELNTISMDADVIMDVNPCISYKIHSDCALLISVQYKQALNYVIEFNHCLKWDTSTFIEYCTDYLVCYKNLDVLLLLITCTFVFLKLINEWDNCTVICTSLTKWRLKCNFITVDFEFVLGTNDFIVKHLRKTKIEPELPRVMKHYCAPIITNDRPHSIADLLRSYKENEVELNECEPSIDESFDTESSNGRIMAPLQMLYNLEGHRSENALFTLFFTFLHKCSFKTQFIDGLRNSIESSNKANGLNLFFKQHPELLYNSRPYCIYIQGIQQFIGPIFTVVFILQHFKILLLSEEMIKWIDFDLQVASGQLMSIKQVNSKQRELILDHFIIAAEFDKKGWRVKLMQTNQQDNNKVIELLKRGQELLCTFLNRATHQKETLISIVKMMSIVPMVSLQMIQLMLTSAKLKNKIKSDVLFEFVLDPIKGKEIPIQTTQQKIIFYFKSITGERTLMTKYQYDLSLHKLEFIHVVNEVVSEATITKISKFLSSVEAERTPEKTRLGKSLFITTSFLHDE